MPDEPVNESHVEITHEGRVVADANVSTPALPHGTAKASFRAEHGQLPPDTRSDLVDAVMDQPGVNASDHLRAVIPMGDSESMVRLQQRTTNLSARAAGSSSLIEADVPPTEDPA